MLFIYYFRFLNLIIFNKWISFNTRSKTTNITSINKAKWKLLYLLRILFRFIFLFFIFIFFYFSFLLFLLFLYLFIFFLLFNRFASPIIWYNNIIYCHYIFNSLTIFILNIGVMYKSLFWKFSINSLNHCYCKSIIILFTWI